MGFVAVDRQRRYDSRALPGKALVIGAAQQRPLEARGFDLEPVGCVVSREVCVDESRDAFAERQVDAARAIDRYAQLQRPANRTRTMLHDLEAGKLLIVHDGFELLLERLGHPRRTFAHDRRSLGLEAAKRGTNPRSLNNLFLGYRKVRRAATPQWARPLALFSYLAIGAPPENVRLPWARTWRALIGACIAGSMARRILRFQPPSFVTDEVCRPFRHARILMRLMSKCKRETCTLTATRQATVRTAPAAGRRRAAKRSHPRSA